jgi:ABC-2 type transport system ATP-binding protein
VQSNTEAPTSAVEISALRVRYGEIEAVSGIDLTIERSAVVALLGPNGAGKSTTINCLIGLKRPHQGQVSVAGSSPREAVRRGRVGAMLQISGLPSGAKVREVIALACSLHRQRGSSAEELLSSAGLEDIAGRAVTKLSGGQAQRVRFAMALAGDPEFLFLDEPTVGMDVESREVFWREVERLAAAGRTILFATHYLAEAERFASRVVMLARGRIVADGTPLDLRSRYQPERVVQLISREVERLRSLDLPGLTALDAENDAVRIRTTDADGTMRALYASGIEIRDVTVETSRLDDVFLKLAQAEEEQ